MQFEWDRAKDEANRRQHGISFQQVKELFTSGVEYLEIFDREHSHDEDRFIAVGPIARGVVLVVYTERQESVVRIISARRATRAESRLFRQHVEGKPALALLRIAARHPRVLQENLEATA